MVPTLPGPSPHPRGPAIHRPTASATLALVLTLALALSAACSREAIEQSASAGPSKTAEPGAGFHELTVKTIDGADKSLKDYRGKTLLVVNTASKCGFTPQYAELQTLYERYKDQDFEVLAFPSNDFGGQEPGSNAAIKSFCSSTYHVTFPLFAKVGVKGDARTPLYSLLTQRGPEGTRGDIKWNFTKFLVDGTGQVLSRFEPTVTPLDATLVKAVEAALPKR